MFTKIYTLEFEETEESIKKLAEYDKFVEHQQLMGLNVNEEEPELSYNILETLRHIDLSLVVSLSPIIISLNGTEFRFPQAHMLNGELHTLNVSYKNAIEHIESAKTGTRLGDFIPQLFIGAKPS